MGVYNERVLNSLKYNNQFLCKPEKDKYKLFGKKDPFTEIQPALLNSVDILKYIMTVGMIESFDINELKGATYSCGIKGVAYSWTSGDKSLNVIDLNKDGSDVIKLPPNSIVFVTIKEFFRLPIYMALRFNLKVQHVYKGLLLGTGPIIDPGFCGHIHIPLHNLTANTYILKKDAKIIDVEFTKMSHNAELEIASGSEEEKIISSLNFSCLKYEGESFDADREFSVYINKALTNDKFYKEDIAKQFVVSALPENIENLNKEIKKFRSELDQSKNEIKKEAERMEKTESYVKSFTFVAFLSVVLACFSLAWSMYSYLSSNTTTKLSEADKKFELQKQMYDDLKKKSDESIFILQNKVNELDKQVKER